MLEKYLYLTSSSEERAEGQGLAEYALILVLVSIAAILALTALGTAVSSVLNSVATTL